MTLNPLKTAVEAVQIHGALQKPGELAGLLALLADAAPEVVLEIGSDAGGTLWAWRQLPSVRRVLAVNLPGAGYHSGRELDSHDAELVIGDSHDPDTLAELTDLLGGDAVDFLLIDGDHTYEGVKQDFVMYAPLVRDGGLVVFHDICPHPYNPEVGVRKFWLELSGDRDEIVTDPATWGGVGVLHVGAPAEGDYVASPLLGSVTELMSR